MKACGLNKIAKTRYICPHKGQNWEVDVFHEANEGLVMGEIELTAANEVISKPDWLLDEVTGDSKYQNANLAVKPFKNWHIEQ